MDENGTLDLSMKKTKREGLQPPEPSSSSSSSSQPAGAPLSQGLAQPEWEEPLDFTKSSSVKEEDHEEVLRRGETRRGRWRSVSDESPCVASPQVEYTAPSYSSSDGEEEDQENLEDRKYPGEVTTSSYKVKFPPKDSKKEVLV